jgi:LPS-assembly protein
VAVIAALRKFLPALRRRIVMRGHRICLTAGIGPVLALVLGFALAEVPGITLTTPAVAQGFTFNPLPPKPPRPPRANDGQMLVQAVEVDYDYNNSRVSAVGNVQLFYNGTSVEADKVVYDQKTKRLHAEGNIRMTDADGKITYANIVDLSDDYRDGFVDSLRVDTADQTRMAATRSDRTNGNCTVQGRPKEAAAVAGQGRAHHPRPSRKDAVFRKRPGGILRRSDGLFAIFFNARSDREAQERVLDAEHHLVFHLRLCR